jgi:hypothetical protein
MERTLDWKAKEAYAKKLDVEGLRFAIKDCIEAATALPENSGYYHDEASVYRKELDKRMKKSNRVTEAKEEWSKCDACGEVFPTEQVIDATGHPACPKCGITDTISKSGKPKTIREATEEVNGGDNAVIFYGDDNGHGVLLDFKEDYEALEEAYTYICEKYKVTLSIDVMPIPSASERKGRVKFLADNRGLKSADTIPWDGSKEALEKVLLDKDIIHSDEEDDANIATVDGKRWVRAIVKNPKDGEPDSLWFSKMDDSTHAMMFCDYRNVGADVALNDKVMPAHPQPYHIGEFSKNDGLYRALVEWLRKNSRDSILAGKTF